MTWTISSSRSSNTSGGGRFRTWRGRAYTGSMRFSRVVAAAVLIVGLAGSTASAQVQLTMHDGLVTIVASNATVRQILAEWARVGHTTILNAERVPGGPITLQLTDVPETQALDLLLRSISGYLAAPRAVTASNLSRYDRI